MEFCKEGKAAFRGYIYMHHFGEFVCIYIYNSHHLNSSPFMYLHGVSSLLFCETPLPILQVCPSWRFYSRIVNALVVFASHSCLCVSSFASSILRKLYIVLAVWCSLFLLGLMRLKFCTKMPSLLFMLICTGLIRYHICSTKSCWKMHRYLNSSHKLKVLVGNKEKKNRRNQVTHMNKFLHETHIVYQFFQYVFHVTDVGLD